VDGVSKTDWNCPSKKDSKNYRSPPMSLDDETDNYAAVPFSQIKARKLRYLWRPFLPIGLLTVITGESGVGKSTFIMDIIARCTQGVLMPQIGNDAEQIARKGSALICCQEDPADIVIKPRLRAAGADMNKVFLATVQRRGRLFRPEDHHEVIERLDIGIEKLERVILQIRDVRILFIDPITAFLGKLDFNREDHVRRLLRPLAELAAKYSIAVVIVIHMNKDTGKKATQRILGSGGFVGANRSTLFVAAPGNTDRRLLMLGKGNNLPAQYRNKAVEFKLNDVDGLPQIEWGTDYEDVNPDAIMSGRAAHVSKLQQAILKLHEWLADGPRPTLEIQELAEAVGFHWNTFRAAKKEIGIRSFRSEDSWWWELPQGDNRTSEQENTRVRRQSDKATKAEIRRERL
jgi:putative DNA primase/helicase